MFLVPVDLRLTGANAENRGLRLTLKVFSVDSSPELTTDADMEVAGLETEMGDATLRLEANRLGCKL